MITSSASALLFAGRSEIRFEPPGNKECGAELRLGGRPAWLVVSERQGTVREFSRSERSLLRSLAGIAQTALDSAHLHARTTAHAERCELTGLLNRRGVWERFATMKEARWDQPVGVIFADLDGFKQVNDIQGHESGDLLLIEAARRLERCVRDRDIVARWGGDEFLIVLSHAADADSAHALAIRIDEAMRAPYQAAPGLRVSASVGVACGTYGRDELRTLVETADQAMYTVKAGRSGYWHKKPQVAVPARDAVAPS